MISKPLQSFLSAHLQGCYRPGTRVQESGIRVSTEQASEEKIILFHIDCDEGRKCLKMQAQGKKICDYLYYYTRETEIGEIVCVLELKGTNLRDAAEQVEMTLVHLKDLIREKIHNKQELNAVWRICICLRGQASSISHHRRIHEELKNKYGKGNVEIKHGITRHDIGPLLRRATK